MLVGLGDWTNTDSTQPVYTPTRTLDFSDDPAYINVKLPPSPVQEIVSALNGGGGSSGSGFLGMSSSSLWTIGVLGLVGLGFYFYEGR